MSSAVTAGLDRGEVIVTTVYMRNDLAEVARVLQSIVRLPVHVERFNACLVPGDISHVRGLESVDESVICLVIVATAWHGAAGERLTKAVNRLISVFKVISVTA